MFQQRQERAGGGVRVWAGGGAGDRAERLCVRMPSSRARAPWGRRGPPPSVPVPSAYRVRGMVQSEYQGTAVRGAKGGMRCAPCSGDSGRKDPETLQGRLRTLRALIPTCVSECSVPGPALWHSPGEGLVSSAVSTQGSLGTK